MTSLGTKCPACGMEGIRWSGVPKYQYRESGLDNVWLMGAGVRQAHCTSCGEELTLIEAEWQLQQVIGIVLLRKEGLLTGPETRFLREVANLTQEELATHLDLKRQATISDRERTVRRSKASQRVGQQQEDVAALLEGHRHRRARGVREVLDEQLDLAATIAGQRECRRFFAFFDPVPHVRFSL